MVKKSWLFIITFFSVMSILYHKAIADTVIIKTTEPPQVVISSEPELIVIPDTYVYYVRASDNDIFFYQGYWWRQWRDVWYRAGSYSGPWIAVHPRRVPYRLTQLPPRWKEIREDNVRVRWRDARDNWRKWERNKYWEKHGWRREVAREREREVIENKRKNRR